MNTQQYTIGQISRITGVSKDTLRFYDKIGLFQPKFVSPRNGYRYYTFDQFWMLDIITCCRRLNITLEDTRQILESNDNDTVVALMKKYRAQAISRIDQLHSAIDYIDWYAEEHQKIQNIHDSSSIYMKYFPEKRVIYSEHPDNQDAFHIALMQTCANIFGNDIPIRRHYGFLIDPEAMRQDRFIKRGEYVEFSETNMEHIGDDASLVFPAGEYLCSIVRVFDKTADCAALNQYLEEHGITSRYIIADEIGLQLFDYTNYGYPCEIRIYMENK